MQEASDAHDPTNRSDVASLAARLVQAEQKLAEATREIDRLRQLYTRTLEQLKLLQRQLFVAKAERTNVATAQLAFDAMFEQAKTLAQALGTPMTELADDAKADDSTSNGDGKRRNKSRSVGRRDLSEADLPIVDVEIDERPTDGEFERIGVEESWMLGHERGGARRIRIRRVVYKILSPSDAAAAANEAGAMLHSPTETQTPKVEIRTSEAPKHLLRRPLLAPSMISHLLVSKYLLGVPFYRLEQQLQLQGVPLDRGTMCRYAEDIGATLGAIVLATRDEAMRTAFCLSTDATGVCIQPGPIRERPKQQRGPCRKGHFFVVLADRDHVFFEYQPAHTSAAVCEMFRGFTGYIQADAHTVYDALFSGAAPRGAKDYQAKGPPPIEVGCWSHSRRDFWEAAVCKHDVGLVGLLRINAIFDADAALKELPPSIRQERRNETVRPLVDAFYSWAKAEHAQPRERGLVASALGYAVRQEAALRRFLDDGRLVLSNNASERALRAIASARKLWMFFGSDDHASAAANLFSLVAGCKLHGLDPEAYLTDIIHVMPYWPRGRYLELAPKYWRATRAQLDSDQLARHVGRISVPAPIAAEQQQSPR